MRPLPIIPVTSADNIQQWSNFHHTVVNRSVPAFLSPGAAGLPTGAAGPQALSQALNSILEYCFGDPPERLCTIGSRWSLSNILDPANVILDPGSWNQMAVVNKAWLTPAYVADAAPRQGTPVIVQGGTMIRSMNNMLGESKPALALQASGASDGHRIAGCIATGTHGSHLKVGAVHDTVLAIYLVTGPNQAVLLQPARRRFTPDLAAWFQAGTALPTQDVTSDDLFNAALVGLGGLGFVHSVIVEAVPLYQWSGCTVARPLTDPDIWHALATLDTSTLDKTITPEFFTIVFSPYASSTDLGAYATLLSRAPPAGPFTPSPPVPSSISTDLSRLLSGLISSLDGPLTDAAVVAIIVAETNKQYQAGPIGPTFPGTYFGLTNLPEGNGRSSEVVVDHLNAVAAVQTVIRTLQSEGLAGRHLLGGIGVRFVPGTTALLGTNIHPMNTYIEFPSLDSAQTNAIHQAIWNALRAAKIPFTCHWGQEYGMDSGSIRSYFADRVDRWKQARATLLPTTQARAVFSNPLLEQLGLA